MQQNKIPDKILTERLTLLRYSPEQSKLLFELINNNRNHLRPWYNWVDSTNTQDDLEDFLQSFDGVGYVAYRKENPDEAIGATSTVDIDNTEKEVEIHYYLGKNHTGNGYAKEIINAFEDTLFATGYDKIRLRINTRNIVSQKFANGAGYAYIETLFGNDNDPIDADEGRKTDMMVYIKQKSDRS